MILLLDGRVGKRSFGSSFPRCEVVGNENGMGLASPGLGWKRRRLERVPCQRHLLAPIRRSQVVFASNPHFTWQGTEGRRFSRHLRAPRGSEPRESVAEDGKDGLRMTVPRMNP